MCVLEKALQEIGLSEETALQLWQTYPEAEIRQQLAWLPLRGCRNRAAVLVASLRDRWPQPRPDPESTGYSPHATPGLIQDPNVQSAKEEIESKLKRFEKDRILPSFSRLAEKAIERLGGWKAVRQIRASPVARWEDLLLEALCWARSTPDRQEGG